MLHPNQMPHYAGEDYIALDRAGLSKLINDARRIVDERKMDYYVSRCYLKRIAQGVPGYTDPHRQPHGHALTVAIEEAKQLFTAVVFDVTALPELSKLEAILGIEAPEQSQLWRPGNDGTTQEPARVEPCQICLLWPCDCARSDIAAEAASSHPVFA